MLVGDCALVTAGLFTGAASYVKVAEQPAAPGLAQIRTNYAHRQL